MAVAGPRALDGVFDIGLNRELLRIAHAFTFGCQIADDGAEAGQAESVSDPLAIERLGTRGLLVAIVDDLQRATEVLNSSIVDY